MVELSVYGFSETRKTLESAVEGHEELPSALFELMKLVKEGERSGEESRNEGIMRLVKEAVEKANESESSCQSNMYWS